MALVGTAKHRRPWLAFLLSLVTTGLGQFYVGRWKRGMAFLAVECLLGVGLVFAMSTFTGLLLGAAILLAYGAFVAVDAWRGAKRAGAYVLQPCNRWWIYCLLISFNLLASGGVDFLSAYATYRIPSESMEQTLVPGDRLMAAGLDGRHVARRGEILIFLFPEDKRIHFVKRVIGLPGETLSIRHRQVFINGTPLKEPYAVHRGEAERQGDDFGPLTIPAGHYFMMGDNREASYDSRFFGPVDGRDIVGRALYLYFPGGGDWARLGGNLR